MAVPLPSVKTETERQNQRERERERETDRQTDRQTDIERIYVAVPLPSVSAGVLLLI